MTRRVLGGTAAVALAAASLTMVGIAQPAAACACGAPTPPDGVSVSVGEERALVTHDGTTQRIDLVLDLRADGADTGLLIPTPSPATVSLGERSVFEALARQTAPRIEYVEDWWGAAGDGAAGGAPDVLSEVDLGPLSAVTLAASDAAGLRSWLDQNGYGIGASVEGLLADYIARGWSFAAFKLTGEEPLDGALDPVRLEFASGDIVYPLLLSQAAQTPQTVRLYLFGADGMQATFPDGTAFGSVVWAGRVTQPGLQRLGAYLTVLEGYFPEPATQITGDLVITSTGARTDHQPVETRTKYIEIGGIPLGYAIAGVASVFGVMLLIVIVGAVVHARSERRRSRAY